MSDACDASLFVGVCKGNEDMYKAANPQGAEF
jgi:hypothetical protein